MSKFVLYRFREDAEPGEIKIMGIYNSLEDVEKRLQSVAKANPKYPLQRIGNLNWWRIGPEEDEGFFGDRPIQLRADEVKD